MGKFQMIGFIPFLSPRPRKQQQEHAANKEL